MKSLVEGTCVGSWCLAIWLASAGAAPAQDRDQEIEALKKQIGDMQKRLEQVEAKPAAGAEAPQDEKKPPASSHLEVAGNRISFYGFARLDFVMSDSRLNSMQFSMWANSEDPTLAAEDDDTQINIYPRLTRFGAKIERDSIPFWDDAKLYGNIEFDFQNGGSESRETPRLRHGYLKVVTDGGFSLLAGQTWDLIAPLWPSVNGDGMMWNSGNLGDRRPQARVTGKLAGPDHSSVDLALAAGRTGAVDLKDSDGDGRRDGEEAGTPMLQSRLGLSSFLGKRLDLGVWGHTGREETLKRVGGEGRFDTSSVGADIKLKLTDWLSVAAESWTGRNLSDVRGGIGQGVNTTKGREIGAQGGWAELIVKPGAGLALAAGGALDDPDNEDLNTKSPNRNQALYGAVRKDFDGGLAVGLEYIRWETDYLNIDEGDANRFNAFVTYSF